MENGSTGLTLRDIGLESRITRLEVVVEERRVSADQRYLAQETAIHVATHSAEVALAEAKTLVKDGFEKNNEWRGSINDVIISRLSRVEYDSAHTALIDKVDSGLHNLGVRIGVIETRLASYEGRSSGIGASLSTILAVGAIAISLIFGILSYMSRGSPTLAPAPSAVAVVPLQPGK